MIKILIIEDEFHTAKELKEMLLQMEQVEVIGHVSSIDETLRWFKNNNAPDLILSDIQLTDGLIFQYFKSYPPAAPVIFCTAFDQFMIKAFEFCGIDYLLKPIQQSQLVRAIHKFENLTHLFSSTNYASQIKQLTEEIHSYKRTFLGMYANQSSPVDVNEIAAFQYENGIIYIHLFNQKKYRVNGSLEENEQLLDPKLFFRVNRQIILHRKNILRLTTSFPRKLQIETGLTCLGPISVSKNRIPPFKKWMDT